jgi:RimJ/RimL family protein N-acetyltransferase
MVTRADGSEPIVHGRTTYLRPAERDDVPTFLRWINDLRTSRFLAFRSPLSTPLEERFFDQMLETQGKTAWFFVIGRLEDDRPVGAIDLHAVDLTAGGAGLGVMIGDPDDTGRGYGADAIASLVDFGFGQLRLERIWLDVYDFNERARRVYERLGFVHEGTLRHAFFRDGRYADVHRMAVLRDEWRSPVLAHDDGA